MNKNLFATVINCMDGRVQDPVNSWIKSIFNVDYIDVITEAGPAGILARGPKDLVAAIKKRVKISVEKHGSEIVALVAHHDCAGNPAPRELHFKDLAKALKVVDSWDFPVRKLGLWVNSSWEAEKVFDDLETDLSEKSPLLLEG